MILRKNKEKLIQKNLITNKLYLKEFILTSYLNEYLLFKKDNKYGIINPQKTEIIVKDCDFCENFKGDICEIVKNEISYIINKKGEILAENFLTYMDFKKNFCIVRQKKVIFYDFFGKELIVLDSFYEKKGEFFIGYIDDRKIIFDFQGKLIYETSKYSYMTFKSDTECIIDNKLIKIN